MLCRQCNTSHAEHELRRGLCIDCILQTADRLSGVIKKYEELVKKYQDTSNKLLVASGLTPV